MADDNKVKGTPAPDAGGKDNKESGESAPTTTKKDEGKVPESTKTVDAGGTPPANPKVDPPKPDDGKGNDDRPRLRFDWRAENRRLQDNLQAAENDAAKANEELNKLRGQIKDGKGNDGELRKQIAAAEAKAEDADAVAKKAIAYAKKAEDAARDAIVDADRKVADAQAAVRTVVRNPEVRDEAGRALAQIEAAGGQQPPNPPRRTAVATADQPPERPDTESEPRRNPPAPRTETQPVRREPDQPRPTETDDCGGGKCCCHPFTTTWLIATIIAIVVAALGMLGWWLATKSSSSAPSTVPTAITVPAPDPLAADKGEFLTHCQLNGGKFEDCLNGFEAVTR